ncbi:hypothetical protein BDV33DRAFT_173129 [Aspergillus novoparasiticus]|uniref:Zn(2)-C6 fungal-type domain-containing protein n=1 Tax=Aspergillus novoparasiticus TaxID=986946 RepID=A0A5N6ESN2_9EURO|nr:hypothetical protein BDV33DRAFT_173129 [Aspergillus novoparasiticus]
MKMVHPTTQPQRQPTASTPSNSITKSKKPKSACDRCRGQKLRCIWDNPEQCRRCARAKAICTVPRPKPMGRPPTVRSSSYVAYEAQEDMTTLPIEETSPLDSSSSGTVSWNILDSVPSLTTTNNLSIASPQPDILEFLNILPESTFGGVFTPNYGIAGFDVEGSGTGVLATSEVPVSQTQVSQSNSVPPGDTTSHSPEKHLQCLRELCELNIALFQHPLHANPAKDQNTEQSHTTLDTTSDSSGDASTTRKPRFSVAELQIGQLLSLTARIKKLVAENGGSERQFFQDRSTALLALSCYTRLELIYSRMLDALRELQSSGEHLTDTEPIMPDLSIDGFSLGGCRDVQLRFAMQICQEALERLRHSIGISGDIRVCPLDRTN